MTRWGKCDYKQLERLKKNIDKLAQVDFEKFCQEVAKELAARLLAKVIKRTPVGEYEDGQIGGTLRRGWTARTEREAEATAVFGGGNSVKAYVDSLQITKNGDVYEIEIINPVFYASYVEFGHRTANHKGWVEGRFMLTISESELDAQAPKIIEARLMKLLGASFDAN